MLEAEGVGTQAYCELQSKCQLSFGIDSIENAEIMENCP